MHMAGRATVCTVCLGRTAGKKMNPHLIRDMIVTYLRGQEDVTEHELEVLTCGCGSTADSAKLTPPSTSECYRYVLVQALAIYMGHSLETQKNIYDRRTKARLSNPETPTVA